MAYLMVNNRLKDLTINSFTHTQDSGTVTEVQDWENAFVRSLLKKYTYTYNNFLAEQTITIGLPSQLGSAEAIAIMGKLADMEINSISFKVGSLEQSSTTYLAKENKTLDGENVINHIYQIDDPAGASISTHIEIKFESTEIGNASGQICSINVSEKLYEFKVRPHTVDVEFISVGDKRRSDGGQVYGTLLGVYRVFKFVSPKNDPDTVEQELVNINYKAGTVENIIYIENSGDSRIVYGSQKKPFSVKTVPARKEANKWYKDLTFQIEEEF